MKGFVLAAIAVAPFGWFLADLYDTDDWQFWALLFSAAWWRFIGPISEGDA